MGLHENAMVAVMDVPISRPRVYPCTRSFDVAAYFPSHLGTLSSDYRAVKTVTRADRVAYATSLLSLQHELESSEPGAGLLCRAPNHPA